MLIICSGPETWSARRKAAELVLAFRQKYDENGYSTVDLGSGDLARVLSEIGTPSLFAKKSLVRRDGLIGQLKIAEVRQLAKRLKENGEFSILLTVEEDEVAEKIIKEFNDVEVKVYKNPLLTGAKFNTWCEQRAKEAGVDFSLAKKVAQLYQGDAWACVQELSKLAVNSKAELAVPPALGGKVFEATDAFLKRAPGWRVALDACDETQKVSLMLAQARSAVKVRDGETADMNSYVVKKMSDRAILQNAESSLAACLKVMYMTRSGLGTEAEML